jgi:hypothetical protein
MSWLGIKTKTLYKWEGNKFDYFGGNTAVPFEEIEKEYYKTDSKKGVFYLLGNYLGLNTSFDFSLIFWYIFTASMLIAAGYKSKKANAATQKSVGVMLLVLFAFVCIRIKAFYKDLKQGNNNTSTG